MSVRIFATISGKIDADIELRSEIIQLKKSDASYKNFKIKVATTEVATEEIPARKDCSTSCYVWWVCSLPE